MFGKKQNVIEFSLDPSVEGLAKIPSPAKGYVPKWYKDIPLMGENNNIKTYTRLTIKACVPFFDTMTTGYIFELWTDVELLKSEDNKLDINWGQKEYPLVDVRTAEFFEKMPTRNGYFPPVFSFKSPLYIKTPPGYSVLITAPFNRSDLPIQILSGIVDTDKNTLYPGNIPFEIPLDASGIIKSGTPIMQIIPFKRSDWKSSLNDSIREDADMCAKKNSSLLYGGYKKFGWTRKNYE